MSTAKHRVLVSRVGGATDEQLSLYLGKWAPERISAEYTDERIERMVKEDGIEKLCIMISRNQVVGDRGFLPGALEKVRAAADVLLRFSAFAGTSTLLVGAHGAGKEFYRRAADPQTFEEQRRYHSAILEAAGTIAHHPNFAYAADVEAPAGDLPPLAKFIQQRDLIEGLRKRYKDLFFVCSTRNWSGPGDLLGYQLPAERCAARVGFYDPFPATHVLDPMYSSLDNDASGGIPYPLEKDVAEKICQAPGLSELAKSRIRAGVGFGARAIEASLRACVNTGIPFLVQEAGFYSRPGWDQGSRVRWLRDVRRACHKLAVPLMYFSTGGRDQWGLDFGLCMGLTPAHERQQLARASFDQSRR